jgi:hypothetical protein
MRRLVQTGKHLLRNSYARQFVTGALTACYMIPLLYIYITFAGQDYFRQLAWLKFLLFGIPVFFACVLITFLLLEVIAARKDSDESHFDEFRRSTREAIEEAAHRHALRRAMTERLNDVETTEVKDGMAQTLRRTARAALLLISGSAVIVPAIYSAVLGLAGRYFDGVGPWLVTLIAVALVANFRRTVRYLLKERRRRVLHHA